MTRTRKAIGGLALVGVAVAAYLTWVHYAGAEPLCVAGGGACEKVQTSEQSELVGVPVAVPLEAICQWCVLSALLMVALGVLCARRVLVEP